MSNVSTITTPTQQFRLSFWHVEVAKLIGEGLPNREIKKRIKISDSRLSILRANPLIKREAARYKQMHEDKYRKALEVFADQAVEMAHQTTALAKNPLMPGQVRLAAIQVALEHAEKLSPMAAQSKTAAGEESFEMLLRMTRRQTGELDSAPTPAELSPERTEAELLEDSYDDGDDAELECATVIDADMLPEAEPLPLNDDAPPQMVTPLPSVAASTTPPVTSGGASSPPLDPETQKLQTLMSKLVV